MEQTPDNAFILTAFLLFVLCLFAVFLSVNMCQLVQFSALLPVWFFFRAICILAPYLLKALHVCYWHCFLSTVAILGCCLLTQIEQVTIAAWWFALAYHQLTTTKKYELNNSKAWPSLLINYRAAYRKPLTTKKESAPERQNITLLFHMLPAWATKRLNLHHQLSSFVLYSILQIKRETGV